MVQVTHSKVVASLSPKLPCIHHSQPTAAHKARWRLAKYTLTHTQDRKPDPAFPSPFPDFYPRPLKEVFVGLMWTWALLARIAKLNVSGHTIICMASCDTILNSYNTSIGPHPMVSIDGNIQPSLQPFLSTRRSPHPLPLTNMKLWHNGNHEQMLIHWMKLVYYRNRNIRAHYCVCSEAWFTLHRISCMSIWAWRLAYQSILPCPVLHHHHPLQQCTSWMHPLHTLRYTPCTWMNHHHRFYRTEHRRVLWNESFSYHSITQIWSIFIPCFLFY